MRFEKTKLPLLAAAATDTEPMPADVNNTGRNVEIRQGITSNED